jgi:uncharacterized membrane protein YidH (DUF202 family)
MGAVGAFLLTFGVFFMVIASNLVNAFSAGSYYNEQLQVAYLQLIGLVLASFGAGLLAFAILSRGEKPSQKV